MSHHCILLVCYLLVPYHSLHPRFMIPFCSLLPFSTLLSPPLVLQKYIYVKQIIIKNTSLFLILRCSCRPPQPSLKKPPGHHNRNSHPHVLATHLNNIISVVGVVALGIILLSNNYEMDGLGTGIFAFGNLLNNSCEFY